LSFVRKRVQELLPSEGGAPSQWSPDGHVVAMGRGGPFMLRDGKKERIPNVPENAWISAFSPDGRWIAYTRSSGRNEVFVQSFPGGNTVHQISSDGGIEVRWRRCGELFWRNGNQWMSSVIRKQPELRWEPPRPAFKTDFIDTPGISYDISVKRVEPDDRSHIMLASNWLDQARRP
jgi:hypothetical protein